MFSLHPQLNADTFTIGELPLSRVLLMNSSEIPWIILVPRRDNISEWHRLDPQDQCQLHKESMSVSAILMGFFNGDKLNTGALGNLVPQLHLHHIVRFKHDSAWPQPVWGNIKLIPYSDSKKEGLIKNLHQALLDTADGFTIC